MTKVTVYMRDNPTVIVFKSNQTAVLVRNELANLIRKKSAFHYTGSNSMVVLQPDLIAGIDPH